MNEWLIRYSTWSQRSPKKTLSVIAFISVLFALCLLRLEINPTPYFLDRDHPSRLLEAELKSLFSNTGETAFVALVAKRTPNDSIFTRDILSTIQRLTPELAQLSILTPSDYKRAQLFSQGTELEGDFTDMPSDLGIKQFSKLERLRAYWLDRDSDIAKEIAVLMTLAKPVKRVRSLSTYEALQVSDDDISVSPLMPSVPETQTAMDQLKAQVLSNPLLVGFLVSETAQATTLQLELSVDEDDSPNMMAIYNALEQHLAKANLPVPHYLGGAPMVTAQTSAAIEQDNFRLMPLVVMVVALVLAYFFRRWHGVVMPLLIAVLTALWTIGSMAALGVAQNIVTTMLPVFLIAIAVADAIHFLNTYYLNRQNHPHGKALELSIQSLSAPLLVTSITTAVAFIVIANTHLSFLREFGLFTALGITYAYLLTVIVLPALLAVFDEVGPVAVLERTNRRAMFVIAKVLDRPVASGLLIVASIGVGALFLPQLHIDNEVIGYFDEGSRIRQDDRVIKDNFCGITPISIWFEGNTQGVFKSPEILAEISEFQQQLEMHPHVCYGVSLADFLKRSNQKIAHGDYQLPTDLATDQVGQFLFFHENAKDQDIRNVVDLAYQNSRLFLSLNTDRAADIASVLDEVKTLSKSLSPDITVRPVGFAEILVTSAQEIVIDQQKNILLALALVFLTLFVLVRSLLLALIALIPLVVSVYFIYVLMAFTGIPLNIGTAIISCISFGVGIDYAIHFLAAIRREIPLHSEPKDAFVTAVGHIASPIMVNSFSLALGFVVLLASGYAAVVHLGILVAISMLVCAVMTLILLPLLLLFCKPAVLFTAK